MWKKVKDEVRSDIALALGEIFNGTLDAVENGYMTKMSVMGIQNKKNKKKIYLIQLRNLKDAQEIRIDRLYLKSFLQRKDALEPFSSVSRRLSDIQIKYYKFLSPELTLSIMRVQSSIFLLETTSQLASSIENLPKELTAAFPQGSQGTFETLIIPSISIAFKKMIEEIYKIHEMGYEIDTF